MTRIVAISDTHSLHDRVTVPDGDILVHAGDHCGRGVLSHSIDFAGWLYRQPHHHKVIVAGNHDEWIQRRPGEARALFAANGITYLQDSGTTIAGLRFWGSPWQPEFCDWAFNLPRGEALREKWALIPDDTDVLITHGPPRGLLDKVRPPHEDSRVGCEELRKAVERIEPKLHIFGHIHESAGVGHNGATRFVNASTCDGDYRPTNPPIVIDVDGDTVEIVR